MNAKYIIVLLIILIAMSSVCEELQQFVRWAETNPTEDVSQSVSRIIRCSGCKQSATRENKRTRPKLSRKGPLPF